MHSSRRSAASDSLIRTSSGLGAVIAMVLAQAAVAAGPQTPGAPAAHSTPLVVVQRDAAKPVAFDIKSQPMSEALTALGAQSGLTIIVETRVSKGLEAAALSGEYTSAEALEKLLGPAGLRAEYLDSTTVAVRTASEKDARDSHTTRAGHETSVLRLAQGAEPQNARPASDDARTDSAAGERGGPPTSPGLEEIVVTAQKRSERLQDVPVPVTALTADDLLSANKTRLKDYFTSVPGLGFTPGAYDEPLISIRGITSDPAANPTVGVAIDDVAYGSSTSQGGGYQAPDLDPGDLQRIEVLRGPQGTLYGASSMGGLLKFVTTDPSTGEVSGRLQSGVSTVAHAGDVGYNLRGSINVPLGQKLAVRVSGFTRRDPGYVDNVQSGQKDVNQVTAEGGRLAALWRPTENVSLKVSALLQNSNREGIAAVQQAPALTQYQQSTLQGTGSYDRDVQFYTATLNVAVGSGSITALSGYMEDEHLGIRDFSASFGAISLAVFGVPGASFVDYFKTTKFTQEVRYSVPITDRLDWLVGGFYTDEDGLHVPEIFAVDPATGAYVGSDFRYDGPTTYREYAGFSNLTWRFTDRFDVQFGARQSRIEQSIDQEYTAPALIGGNRLIPQVDTRDSAFTYLITPRFKASEDLMAYARLASGYRPGGPNVTALPSIPNNPFRPDRTQNYEVGVKGAVFDRTLSFDASVYYIDWKDVQLLIRQGNFVYYSNASRAKSRGVELSGEYRPTSSLTISAWSAWNDAELAEDFPATSTVFGRAGDRLPYSSRYSGNLSLDQEFPLPGAMSGFIGTSLVVVGERAGGFRSGSLAGPQPAYPGYVQWDLRAGLKRGSLSLNAFVTNVANKRGVLSGDPSQPALGFNYIEPRTIGLNVDRTF